MEQMFTNLGLPGIGFALCYILLKQNFKIQEAMMNKFDKLSEAIDKLTDKLSETVKEEWRKAI